jgi:hypothetical protein
MKYNWEYLLVFPLICADRAVAASSAVVEKPNWEAILFWWTGEKG